MVVKEDVLSDYNVYAQEFLKRTVWSENCRAWYKSGKAEGNVTGVYQGSTLHYKGSLSVLQGLSLYMLTMPSDLIENAGFEHFDIVYRSKNRFNYMGNGTSIRDEGGAGDLAYYMDDVKL